MFLTILVGGILFWILYYFFEGFHDGVFANEVKLLKSKIPKGEIKDIENDFVKHELAWHWYDGLEKALVKIVLSILIYIITNSLLFSLQMLLLAVAVRAIAHDFFISIKMNKGLNHIGPDFLWWDRFLRIMSNKGINQYVIKLIPIIVIILWIILTIK